MNEAESVHEVSTQEGYARWTSTYDGETNALIVLEEEHASLIMDSLSFTNALDVGAGTVTGQHMILPGHVLVSI